MQSLQSTRRAVVLRVTFFTFVLGVLAGVAPTMAQSHVKDGAKFFSPAAAQQAEAALAKLKGDKQRNVVIETFETPPAAVASAGGDPAKAWNAFAVEQTKAHSADVYLVVTRTSEKLEMATAREPRDAVLDEAGRASARGGAQAMLTAFKAKDYDGGLRAAVDQFTRLPGRGQGSKTLTFDGPAAAGSPAATPAPQAREGEGVSSPAPAAEKKSGGILGGIGCFGLLIIGVVALVVITLIRKLMGGNRNAAGYNRTAYDPEQPQRPAAGPTRLRPTRIRPGPVMANRAAGMGGVRPRMAGGVLGGLLGGYLGNRAFGSGPNAEGHRGRGRRGRRCRGRPGPATRRPPWPASSAATSGTRRRRGRRFQRRLRRRGFRRGWRRRGFLASSEPRRGRSGSK
jgi:uncharacterized membrane protein YgcG